MKCPLPIIELYQDSNSHGLAWRECDKEECAWWSEELQQCDPTGLLPYFIALGNTLSKIADKMPKDLAPRG